MQKFLIRSLFLILLLSAAESWALPRCPPVTLFSALLRVLVCVALLLFACSPLFADDAVPRGPDGKPSFNGTWQAFNRANDNLEAHAAKAARAFQPGPVNPVPAREVISLGAVGAVPAGMGVVSGGSIPYLPDARRQQVENKADWLNRDPEIKCYLPGIPRATYLPYPFQIFHNRDALLFAYEYAGAVRNIHLRDADPAPVDSWMGQSVAHWEGDTLVIVTTGQNRQTWLDRAGNFHSDTLIVTERFSLAGSHRMDYEATLEDPNIFSKPWTINMTLYRLVGNDAQLQQFNCVEFVEELIYGHLRKVPVPR